MNNILGWILLFVAFMVLFDFLHHIKKQLKTLNDTDKRISEHLDDDLA